MERVRAYTPREVLVDDTLRATSEAARPVLEELDYCAIREGDSPILHTTIWYRGYVPASEFPKGVRVIYTKGLQGDETKIEYSAISPVAVVDVK